jgi:ribosomal protein L20
MGAPLVAPKKRENRKRDIIQFRAPPEWIDRVNAHAERLGLNMSAYIRMKITQAMDAEPPLESEPKKGKRS